MGKVKNNFQNRTRISTFVGRLSNRTSSLISMSHDSITFYPYQVHPREVDFTKRATLFSLGDSILHTAGEDADRTGFGVRNLQQHNTTWVLSRMAIEIERYPDEYEHYEIGTWISEIGRMMTTRNFIVRDNNGNRIAAASTNWAIIDMQSRRPLDLRANVSSYSETPIHECPIEAPRRIAGFTGEMADDRYVRYSEIDFNQHTNTMKYIQWMMDTLPLSRLQDTSIRRMDINFIHETRYGEHLRIYHDTLATEERFEIRRASDELSVCRASFQWKEQ